MATDYYEELKRGAEGLRRDLDPKIQAMRDRAAKLLARGQKYAAENAPKLKKQAVDAAQRAQASAADMTGRARASAADLTAQGQKFTAENAPKVRAAASDLAGRVQRGATEFGKRAGNVVRSGYGGVRGMFAAAPTGTPGVSASAPAGVQAEWEAARGASQKAQNMSKANVRWEAKEAARARGVAPPSPPTGAAPPPTGAAPPPTGAAPAATNVVNRSGPGRLARFGAGLGRTIAHGAVAGPAAAAGLLTYGYPVAKGAGAAIGSAFTDEPMGDAYRRGTDEGFEQLEEIPGYKTLIDPSGTAAENEAAAVASVGGRKNAPVSSRMPTTKADDAARAATEKRLAAAKPDPAPGFNAAMTGIRKELPFADYNSRTSAPTIDQESLQERFPVNVGGKNVGWFARAKGVNAPMGVRDMNDDDTGPISAPRQTGSIRDTGYNARAQPAREGGTYQRGAVSEISSPFAAQNLSKPENAGLRGMIENVDIRQGVTRPRPSEAEMAPEFAKLKNDLAIAKIAAGAKLNDAILSATTAREKAAAEQAKVDYEQGTQLQKELYAPVDPNNLDEVAAKKAAYAHSEQLLHVAGVLKSPRTVQLTHDGARIAGMLAEGAEREGSTLGEFGSHVAEIFAPKWMYSVEGVPPQDLDTMIAQYDGVLGALQGKAGTYTYPDAEGNLVEMDLDQGFFSRISSGRYISKTDQKILEKYVLMLKGAAVKQAAAAKQGAQ